MNTIPTIVLAIVAGQCPCPAPTDELVLQPGEQERCQVIWRCERTLDSTQLIAALGQGGITSIVIAKHSCARCSPGDPCTGTSPCSISRSVELSTDAVLSFAGSITLSNAEQGEVGTLLAQLLGINVEPSFQAGNSTTSTIRRTVEAGCETEFTGGQRVRLTLAKEVRTGAARAFYKGMWVYRIVTPTPPSQFGPCPRALEQGVGSVCDDVTLAVTLNGSIDVVTNCDIAMESCGIGGPCGNAEPGPGGGR